MGVDDRLDLLDWKRRIFAVYKEVRDAEDPRVGWDQWRQVRDELFAHHPQSPIPAAERESFRGLTYYDYDPAARVLAEVEHADPEHFDIQTSGDGTIGFTRFGVSRFELAGERLGLDLYWLDGYGGGVFLSFRDGTSGSETYGACRYLLDSVKGADLGTEDGRLVLDFNFAYNPSCAYDPRWVCPLATPANRLEVPVRAGERIA
ncbi:MAG TPA: DUF1684 domain-containing protein [Actinomycetota bacterium]|nr:DUF1684 domain-containing protein [Actinomycetota bacterium]